MKTSEKYTETCAARPLIECRYNPRCGTHEHLSAAVQVLYREGWEFLRAGDLDCEVGSDDLPSKCLTGKEVVAAYGAGQDIVAVRIPVAPTTTTAGTLAIECRLARDLGPRARFVGED